MELEKRVIDASKLLLIFMTSIFCITEMFFFFGVSINYFNFIISIGIMLVAGYYMFAEKKEKYLWDICICLIIICITALFAMNVYDNTWDGCAYHKQAVGLLKEGWNPVYMLSNDFNNAEISISNAKEGPLLWAESYPKATWYYAAVIYYITGNIEAGKSYTLLFAFITYGICLEFFGLKINGKAKYLLALFISLNPIVCAQFQSYYLDGVVASIISLLIVLFIQIIDSKDKEISKLQYIEIGCLIIWGCNLKFSVVAFIITACGLFLIFNSLKLKKIDVKNFIVLFVQGIMAVFVFGFAPYITNVIRHGNMFYSLGDLMNESDMQAQFGIQGLNRTGRFVVSIFGKMSHGEYKTLKDVLKIPFTFSAEEIQYYSFVDTRVGGFGIFFSGLLVISILVIIISALKMKKNNQVSLSFLFTIFFALISAVEFCFIPQTSQFRYIPHMYLFIILAIYLLMKKWRESNVYKSINVIFCLLIMVNLLPWGWNAVRKINQGTFTTATLKGMEKECVEQGINYEIAFYCDDFTGMYYNLKDFNISYVYKSVNELETDYRITYSNWLYYRIGN